MGSITGSIVPTDLAEKLMAELNAGRPARATFGVKDTAFAWALGAPRGFWSFASTATAESMKFGVVVAGAPATPATKVAEKGTKPEVCGMTAKDITLGKYAGRCCFTLETELSTAGMAEAVSRVIIGSALVALEDDLATGIVGAAGSTVDGAGDWTTGILKGIGAVVGAGGNPSVLAISPEDFAGALTTQGQLMFTGTDAIASYLGLRLHISPALSAGTAVVMDPGAVLVIEHNDSPVVILDPYTKASTNEICVTADVVAGFEVVNSAGVVTVTKGTSS